MYIAFEGVDVLGKTTQFKLLKNYLNDFRFIKEGYNNDLDEKIREIILWEDDICETASLFLFLASRAELFNKIDFKSENVISDRSLYSHIAYAINYDYKTLFELNMFATKGVIPDKVIFFKGSKKLLEQRLAKKEQCVKLDKFEQKGVDYLLRIQDNYEKIFNELKVDYVTINASDSKESIHEQIKNILKDLK